MAEQQQFYNAFRQWAQDKYGWWKVFSDPDFTFNEFQQGQYYKEWEGENFSGFATERVPPRKPGAPRELDVPVEHFGAEAPPDEEIPEVEAERDFEVDPTQTKIVPGPNKYDWTEYYNREGELIDRVPGERTQEEEDELGYRTEAEASAAAGEGQTAKRDDRTGRWYLSTDKKSIPPGLYEAFKEADAAARQGERAVRMRGPQGGLFWGLEKIDPTQEPDYVSQQDLWERGFLKQQESERTRQFNIGQEQQKQQRLAQLATQPISWLTLRHLLRLQCRLRGDYEQRLLRQHWLISPL